MTGEPIHGTWLQQDQSELDPAREVPELIGEGANAWIITGSSSATVFKVFKDNSNRAMREYRTRAFEREVEAHRIAKDHPRLSKIVPTFLGLVNCDSIRRVRSGDTLITMCPLSNCAFEMKLVPRCFDFPNNPKKPPPERWRDLLVSAGIRYVKDASCAVDCLGRVKAIVDVQTCGEDAPESHVDKDPLATRMRPNPK